MIDGATLDLASVSAPLSPDQPAGVDLRATNDADYQQLRDRVEESQRRRRSLERGDPADSPDWTGIVDRAGALLSQKTKDIQILSWLIESSTRAYGLTGLAASLEPAATLVAALLPQMHPQPEDGDDEFRLRPLISLDNGGSGTLITLIQQQPIITAPSLPTGGYTILHLQQANLTEKLDPEKREQRVRDGAVTYDQITQAANKMPAPVAAEKAALLDRAIAATQKLQDGLLKHCGIDAPPTSKILESLESCRSMLNVYAKAKLNGSPATAASTPTSAASGSAPTSHSAGLMNRESILSAIGDLVNQLDSLEPQNLAVPAFHQAITWARMDRVALLTDLLGDASGDSAREKLFRLIGLKAPAKESEE